MPVDVSLLSEDLLPKLVVEFRPPDLCQAKHEVLKPPSLKFVWKLLFWKSFLDESLKLTSEQTETASVRIPKLFGTILAEVSCPEPVSGLVGIRRVSGEVFSNWALFGPS